MGPGRYDYHGFTIIAQPYHVMYCNWALVMLEIRICRTKDTGLPAWHVGSNIVQYLWLQ